MELSTRRFLSSLILIIAVVAAACVEPGVAKTTPEAIRNLLQNRSFQSLVSKCDSNARLILRGVFHDATSRSRNSSYAGAVDGSLRFELRQNDNRNIATVVQPLVSLAASSQVSFADALALASVLVVKNCGGPIVSFSYGRVDAASAGPLRSILPFSASFKDLSAKAQDMGMTVMEFGILVAGAHSVATTPQLGGGNLDATPAKFDNSFADEMVHSLQKPPTGVKRLQSDVNLVSNKDIRSLYKHYAESEESLMADFSVVFEKMLNLGWGDRLQRFDEQVCILAAPALLAPFLYEAIVIIIVGCRWKETASTLTEAYSDVTFTLISSWKRESSVIGRFLLILTCVFAAFIHFNLPAVIFASTLSSRQTHYRPDDSVGKAIPAEVEPVSCSSSTFFYALNRIDDAQIGPNAICKAETAISYTFSGQAQINVHISYACTPHPSIIWKCICNSTEVGVRSQLQDRGSSGNSWKEEGGYVFPHDKIALVISTFGGGGFTWTGYGVPSSGPALPGEELRTTRVDCEGMDEVLRASLFLNKNRQRRKELTGRIAGASGFYYVGYDSYTVSVIGVASSLVMAVLCRVLLRVVWIKQGGIAVGGDGDEKHVVSVVQRLFAALYPLYPREDNLDGSIRPCGVEMLVFVDENKL
ncbi:hypothetical protein HDU67_005398 [Dinochytrium kinnereticum]|nr:hypothetical protein HDU67_005398 [Dinochytrium kinnereticum]